MKDEFPIGCRARFKHYKGALVTVTGHRIKTSPCEVEAGRSNYAYIEYSWVDGDGRTHAEFVCASSLVRVD